MAAELEEWRESAQDLYERLDSVLLSWPSLSIEWMSDDREGRDVLEATYTMHQEDEFVREVRVDSDLMPMQKHQLREYALGEFEALSVRQHGRFFAAFCEGGVVRVFGKDKPQPILEFSASNLGAGGFGLAFDPRETQDGVMLVSGSEKGELVLWRLGPKMKDVQEVARVEYDCDLNDVTWTHPEKIVVAFGTGDVEIFDRELKSTLKIPCFAQEATTASLNPHCDTMLVAGSANEGFSIFDTVSQKKLYTNEAHDGEIRGLKWSPTRDLVLASAGTDCCVYLWNLRKVGDEQSYEDAQDGPPELIFKHIGHSQGSTLNDLAWHPRIDMLLASCDGKNTLMTWKPIKDVTDEVHVPQMPSYIGQFLKAV